MTEILGTNTSMPDTQRAFDTFVGFLYGLLVALVIKTSYSISNFDSFLSVTLTLILLSFFAYDWMSRYYGRSKMSENMTTKSAYLYVIKLFLDIAIVYFLLLFSLKFVELYAPLTLGTISEMFKGSCNSFCYSMAMFALVSGIWNVLMINISTDVNMPEIINLIKGHLDQKIIKLFPVIKNWRDDIKGFVDEKHKEMAKLKERGSFDTDDSKEAYRKEWRELESQLGVKLYFKCFVTNPHHILLPYLFVFHIVFLNFVLGFFIILSALLFNGKSLFLQLQILIGLSVPVWILPVGVVLGLVLLILHFKTGGDVTYKEKIGSYVLLITVIISYAFCSAVFLIGLVVVQQLIANFIMTKYFEPPPTEKLPAHNYHMADNEGAEI